MAMLCCQSNEINAQKTKCLTEINCQLGGDYYSHRYNKDGLLDSTHMYIDFTEDEYYYLFKYDDRGNIITEDGYCILPNSDPNYHEFTKTFEIKYEFDENNRRISRKNYNWDTKNSEFILGGMYVYEYNDKGQLTERKLYWDEAKTDLFERAEYTYNEKGQLVKELYISCFWGTDNESSMQEYFYDENGNMTRIKTSTANMDYELEESQNRIYKYDENNNLTTRITYDTDPELPNEQHILVYDEETDAENVAFPINYENDMDFYVNSKNVVIQDTIYQRNMDTNTFDLFEIQDWVYEDLADPTGIENVYDGGKILGFTKDNDGNIILNGIDNAENVRIYDANGRIVMNGSYNGMINTGSLPNGMYILLTRQGCIKFSR